MGSLTELEKLDIKHVLHDFLHAISIIFKGVKKNLSIALSNYTRNSCALRCFKIPPNQNLASPTGIMQFQPIWRLYMKGQLIVTSQIGPTFDLKFFHVLFQKFASKTVVCCFNRLFLCIDDKIQT